VINHRALLPGYALGDLDQPELHPRPDLVQPHRAPLPLAIVPPHVVVRQAHRLALVPRGRARVARRTLVPRVRASAAAQHKVRDVALAAEVEHVRVRRRARLGRALEHLAHAARDAERPDGDEVVPDVERAALGAVGDEHDAPRGGELERLGRERREE
jgi:hypothetical protein